MDKCVRGCACVCVCGWWNCSGEVIKDWERILRGKWGFGKFAARIFEIGGLIALLLSQNYEVFPGYHILWLYFEAFFKTCSSEEFQCRLDKNSDGLIGILFLYVNVCGRHIRWSIVDWVQVYRCINRTEECYQGYQIVGLKIENHAEKCQVNLCNDKKYTV